MPRVRSFPPVAAPDAEILVLGSMPGEASLAANRYYAHPRNAFWPIVGALLGLAPNAAYEERLAALTKARIALWDVLHSCHREGSLDSAIDPATQRPNDFAKFFRAHRSIRRVCFNGAKAEHAYRTQVLAEGIGADLEYLRLPSTSPANASWSFERKLEAWRRVVLEGSSTA